MVRNRNNCVENTTFLNFKQGTTRVGNSDVAKFNIHFQIWAGNFVHDKILFVLLHIIKIVDIWYRNYIMWFILPLTHPSWVQQHSNFQNCCSKKKNRILSPWSPILTCLGLKWPYQVIDSDEKKNLLVWRKFKFLEVL